jgi:hypothetical protein
MTNNHICSEKQETILRRLFKRIFTIVKFNYKNQHNPQTGFFSSSQIGWKLG